MDRFESYQAENVIKIFSGVTVLHGVDFTVKAGNIHGLFGHNGAGKSTLLKILAGVNQPDGGQLLLNSEPIHLHSPKDALSHRIACVYQELRLIPELTVWRNLFLGRELTKGVIIDEQKMKAHAVKILEEYQLNISPDSLVKDLSHPEKQMLEVITNLDRDAKFLFLDEPTTALEGAQAESLLKAVQRIAKQKQIGVVLVSHKLDEVLSVCDEATVMCGGKVIFYAEGEAINKQAIIDAIIGDAKQADDQLTLSHKQKTVDYQNVPLLTVKNLKTERLKSISLQAYSGEILGIYGLAGSGRTRFGRTLYGLENLQEGNILLSGKNYRPSNPDKAIKQGIAYLTEERKKDGFIPLMSSISNSTLSVLSAFKRGLFVDHRKMNNSANNILKQMDTKGDLYGPMKSLSGGNQQKVLFSRVINQNANLVILDEPTKGVDIGAKSDIYKIIYQLAENNCCVIVISSEEEELIEISDRILVFKQGHCDGEAIPTDKLTTAMLREAAWSSH